MSGELAALARELRARVEISEEGDWAASTPQGASSSEPQVVLRSAERAPTSSGKAERLAALAAQVSACRKCPLGAQRLNAVFGVGSAEARVVFVGEGPGFDEDHKGEPFVGKSGQLLDRILASIGLSRAENAYIANIVKCHPMSDPSDPEKRGNDRPPTPEETAACRGYLDAQLEIIQPRAIVTLGGVSAKVLLGTATGITALRGTWREYRGIPLLPTFHPAALLRDPALKRDVWEDMKSLKKRLEEAP